MTYAKKYIFLFFLLALCIPKESVASHISGINIGYECIGGNTYRITVNVFRDCQDLNLLPANLNVFISSSCNSVGYAAFPQIALTDVSQLCPSELPNSKCSGGNLPGIQLGVYQLDVELIPCSDWTIVVSEQNRDIATTNLLDPSLYSLHVEAFLNNSVTTCNDSPQLTLLNLPYTCVGNPLYYNLGFIDPNGDSLSYALVPAQASVTPNAPFDLTYLPTYSGSEPIPGITIDPTSGQIEVTPMQIGKFNAVVQVSEYRNGILIGQVSYDFLFVVNPCAIPPPAPVAGSLQNLSGGGYPLDANTIGICAGDNFCFKIDFASSEPSVNVALSSNIDQLIPGATETTSGTNPVQITFCGTLPPGFAGGDFIVTAKDDACPVYGQAYYAIDFALRQPLKAFNDTTICLGQSVQLTAFNDTIYTWATLSGNPLVPGNGITCNPCYNPIVNPDTTTAYIVTGQYANSSCPNTDTITVNIPLQISTSTADESCTGSDGVIAIDIQTGSGNYDVVWSDIGPGPTYRNDLTAGSYTVTITDLIFGCSRTDTFDLIQWDPPTANAGTDFEICGLSANLSAIPSYGNPSWSAQTGVVFNTNVSANTAVTVPAEGIYPFVWTEDAGIGCVESDTVWGTFYAQPTVQILAEDSICGLQIQLGMGATPGIPTWIPTPGLNIQDPSNPTTTASAAGFGAESVFLEIQNGLCVDQDSLDILFIEQPIANAGADLEFCGLTGTLAALDGVGVGTWILPPDLTSSSDLTNENLPVEATSYDLFEATRVLDNLGYCQSEDTTTIRFTEQPLVNLGPDFGVCDSVANLGFPLPVGSLTWELSPNLNAPATVSSPAEFSGSFGTHQVILHADNGFGCVDSDTLTLYLSVQPTLDPVLADTVCGLEYILDGQTIADAQYWLPLPGTNIADLTNPSSSVSVTGEGWYTFAWVAENGGACRDTALIPVLFYDQPMTDAGGDTLVCGLSTALSATASYGNFLWEDLPGLTFENTANPTSEITSDWYNTYQITASETNGICADSDQVEVTFISTPEIQNPQWICTGTDTEFILTFEVSLGDTANYAIGGLPGVLEDFLFISEPVVSNTAVTVVLDDLGYCGGDTLSGTKFCPILTDAGEMDPDTVRLCGNDWLELNAAINTSLDGNDTLLYAFHDGTATTLGIVFDWNTTPNFAFGAGLIYDETYYVSSVAGNASADGVNLNDPLLSVSQGTPVEFYQPPQSLIEGNFIACPYDTVWIPVEMEGAMPQELSYTMGGQVFSQWVDSEGFEIMASDSGEVQLISTHSEFCVGDVSGTVQLDYYALPSALISTSPEICEGDTAQISIVFSGVSPFSAWLTQNGNTLANLNSTTDSISLPTTTGGDFILETITDENCTNPESQSIHLTVNPLPLVDAGSDLDGCDGDTVWIGTAAISGQTYAWAGSDGLLTSEAAQVNYITEINSPFPQTTALFLTAQRDGCYAKDTLLVTTFPVPVPQIIGAHTVCSTDSLSLIGYGGAEYYWQPAAYFGHPNSVQSLFSAPTDTLVELTVISQAGCSASITHGIEVLPSPDSLFFVSDLEGCVPFTVSLEAYSTQPGNQYSWQVGAFSHFPDANSIASIIEEPGNYSVALTVTASNGCTSKMTWSDKIEAYSTFAAFNFFPENPDITHPEVFFRNLSPPGVVSEWRFDTLSIQHSRNARFTFPTLEAGHFDVCLFVTDSNMCKAELCKTIDIRGKRFVYVPTAFTPDGDGLNDYFYPVLTHVDVVGYHFWITNIRGQVIFDSRTPGQKWDGSAGVSQYYERAGVYNWFLIITPDFNIETEYLQGSVTLIR